MNSRQDIGSNRLDDAARAGWLYYVAGNTQDQIAATLGISRQTAQRLVSLAVSEGLVKVRLDHPIANCMDLAARLRSRYALDLVEVVPSDPTSSSTTIGIAEAAAAEIERRLRSATPIVMAIGTGRTLKAAIEQLPPMDCPQHKVVSLTGNISPDGSAAFYNVIFTMADRVKARSFPMPLPVIASSPQEREMLLKQPMIQPTLALAAEADVTFVGIGDLGPKAPQPAPEASAPAAAAPAPVALMSEKEKAFREMVTALHRHVSENAEHVGKRFADEALKIHHGEAEERAIYGEATPDDAQMLHEEGVDFLPLPGLPDSRN